MINKKGEQIMVKIEIKELTEKHYSSVLEINEQLVHFLSPLTLASLDALCKICTTKKVVEVDGVVAAFILALEQGQPYQSENYAWFEHNLNDYYYVDRLAILPNYHRLGIGSLMHNSVKAYAIEKGIKQIALEIDIQPINEVSLAFHKQLGFKEIDTLVTNQGKKIVSLQHCILN